MAVSTDGAMSDPRITHPSVLRGLQAWTERCPDKLLFSFLDIEGQPTEQYSYSEFWARTTDVAAQIQQQGLKPGDRVLLAYPPGLEVICAFFAATRLGLVPVPVYPPSGSGFASALRKMNFIAQDCGASAVLTDRSWYWSMRVNQARHRIKTWTWSRDRVSKLPWIVTTDAARAREHEVREAHSPLLFLQYTSGSTSQPKGVMVTHDNLLANGDAVVDHLPVGVSWLPQYHDMGLIGYYLFFALKGGTTYGFSPIDFIRRPALWLETISKVRGTASSAPNFAYEYCLRPGKISKETRESLDLTSLRFLMNAAEPVRPHVVRQFLATFQSTGLNPSAFFSAYGLAEHTLAVSNYGRRIASFDREALSRDAAEPAVGEESVSLVSCGRPLGQTELRIVDQAGRDQSASGGVGEVWIDGPSKCAGYFGRPELTEATFRAKLDTEPDREWLRTGDLGFLHDGELFLTGRAKDLIIVRGQNIYPQDLEQLVEEDPAVRKGCVAAFAHDTGGRERVVVVCEVRDAAQLPDVDVVGGRIVDELGVALDELVCIEARSIPKTSSGKIVRHAAREQFVEGSLRLIERRTPRTLAVVGGAVSQALELGPYAEVLARFGLRGHETGTAAECGLDSIQMVELAAAIKGALQDQGHEELLDAVDLNVLQTLAVCELTELLGDLVAAKPGARLRFRRVLSQLSQEHRSLEKALMLRDARLRFDPAHLPRTGEGRGPGLLLTGGTGFFGPFLLASLLEQHTGPIHVLVRARNEAHGKERLLSGLAEVLPELPASWSARIVPVLGDLTRTNLGLDTQTWGRLASEIGTIVHNGAVVNYLFDYATMRDANVGGTNEIVRLAMSHRPAVLDYISTTFTFGWSVKDTLFEGDTHTDLDLLDFGYSQTKWVAEQVVYDAMRQGLSARVFRPALLTPSLSGGGSHFDISVRLIAFMLDHGLGTTAANQVSFSPADLAASNIVAICREPESLGGTFHVTRDVYASMADITGILGQLTGVAFEQMDLDDFVPAVIERCGPDDLLYPLLEFFVRSIDNITKMEFKRYDNSGFARFRDASPEGQADPPLEQVVLGLLRFMRRHGITAAQRLPGAS